MDTPAATEMLAALPKDSASVAIIAQHAKQGDPDAMFAMCIFAHEHNDHELAVSWAEKASAAGNSEAKTWLAEKLEASTQPTDPEKAHALLIEAAEKGNQIAMCRLGTQLWKGRGCARDLRQAVHWYELAAQKGVALAQHRLGYFYEHGLPCDDDTASPESLLPPLAGADPSSAGPRSTSTAAAISSAAPSASSPVSTTAAPVRSISEGNASCAPTSHTETSTPPLSEPKATMAPSQREPFVLAANVLKAVEYYTMAAEQEFPESILCLANLLWEGSPPSLPANPARAVELWDSLVRTSIICDESEKPAIKGMAATALARAYIAGRGVPERDGHQGAEDESRAFPDNLARAQLLTMAAALGDTDAMMLLGILYGQADPSRTLGVAGVINHDPQKSYFWIKRAADKGNPNAPRYLARFKLATKPAAPAAS